MLLYLLLLFTIVPLVELSILIWIGNQTAWWLPILMVIGTGIAGTALARWQGWQVLRRIRADADAGRMPAEALIDGFLILIAGLLLITPGVLSDLLGILLLIPPVRAIMKRAIAVWIRKNIEVRISRATGGFGASSNGRRPSLRDEIVDARVVHTRVEDAEQ
jgi:UPF0716 protein FxsA